MRPTRFGLHGALFYAVMLGAFFASPYSNLFFLLLGFLTILGLSGVLAARRNLRGVTASLADLPPLPSGAAAQVPLRLTAPGPARFQLEASLLLEGGERLAGRLDLLQESGSAVLRVPPLPRGCHAVRRARVESAHPFGLLRVSRPFEAPAELVVYPAPLGPRALVDGRSAAEALDELLALADPRAGELQPSGLRDHREGEGLRGVHWRASARRARLVVQEWEGGGGRGLEVVLDQRCAEDELEQALGTLSAMVSLARSAKETLRIHSQELAATFGDGQRPWAEALRFLARARALPSDAPAPPATSPQTLRLPRARTHA